eukprot:GILI01001510.1.p2 GENE.GILI01001510.1~~GILI01001510.1.p2  ORF type:complete len:380 (-),score=89.33 GILI01001510.1:3861-5000(-)
MKLKHIAAAAIAAATLPAAYAVDIQAGDWTVSVGGNINAFYTQSECKGGSLNGPASAVTGAAIGDAALACGGKKSSTVVGNGLLPSYLSVGAKSKQGDYDVGAVVGIGVAAATNSAIAQNSEVDVRQAYLTFGNKDMGTVKLGRDYGTFGFLPIISDMTLLGVGAATRATQNGRVSLGHIGAGYTYVGNYGQIVYSTPSLGGVGIDVGVFNPIDSGTLTAKNSPQLQARASFGGQGFKAWVAGKTQKFDGPASFTMNAVEVGGSASLGAFGLVGNYQSGKGIGILSDGDQGNVKGKNYLLQGTFQATDKIKLGLGNGRSRNETGTGSGVRTNESTTAGVYFGLTKSVTLVGEYAQTKSKAFNNNAGKQNSIAAGAIFFF